jgi:small GTP-binding protein
MFVTQHLTTYKVKILLLGASDSGKISFCSKYSSGFSKTFEQSIGVDIFVREEEYPDGEDITYSCWVCAPERRFEYYWPKFFRGASGVFIMFDVTNRESFKEVNFWYETVKKNLGLIPVMLLGNKIDLISKRVVEFKEAKSIAEEFEIAAYLDISVKKNINVSESFEILNGIIYSFLSSDKEEFHPNDLDSNIRNRINELSSVYK